MYHNNVSGRSSDLRALLIAGFIRRVAFVNNGWRERKETPSSKLENSVPSSHVLRERKETIEQLKILDTPPR
ncbi:hypothetical protein T01_14942 [Trichinella spiralis]|uniref:Uncharacterized protein n=1 Tax=Trichinella spiralis TaxID=6334 RepID=A0A0V1AIL3_TRISP|nr:hypothetical protein T01_14942 [Trichinella spiralis]